MEYFETTVNCYDSGACRLVAMAGVIILFPYHTII